MNKIVSILFAALLLTGCGSKNEEANTQWEYCVVSIEGSKTPQTFISSDKAALEKASDYKALRFPEGYDMQRVLNNYGHDGWELVDVYTNIETVFPNMGDEQYHTGIKDNTRTQSVNFVFKKRKKQ